VFTYHSSRLAGIKRQYAIGLSALVAVSLICYLVSGFIGYRVVALVLLVTVSGLSMFCDILPIIVIAATSAFIWNFFFIPPRFTFSINNAEDLLMFLMYFMVAMVNAVFTNRIRKAEQEANRRRERENVIALYNTLLNSLSHELRTPISTIIGAADNLQAMSDHLSEYNKYELVSEISKASLRLNRQVENLLNMSRLESGQLEPKRDWVDVKELIYDVVNHLREPAYGKPVQVIVPDSLPLFMLDYGLLFQVLHNLVHNALSYIPKYAVVMLKVTWKNDRLIIFVEDTGNGFPDNEIARVFDKFYRLKDSRTGGTGLGLSIAKGFVESMGGRIAIENMKPAGARFTIALPCEVSHLVPESV
jgi:two-component system, OmpR family, sensor histidine kinase KdpD